MTTSTSVDPFFIVRDTPALTARDIAAVASGRIAVVRVPSMLAKENCLAVLRSLETTEFDTYDPARVFPRVAKFGPGVNDYRSAGGLHHSYWDAAEKAWDEWRKIALPIDPIQRSIEIIASAWPGNVSTAALGGRRMFAGVIREINLGLQIHFDDVIREYDDSPFGEEVVAQLAFNLYLHVPDFGGETIIWRKRWHPGDEEFNIPNGYGYTEAVVRDVDSVKLKPETGEAFLFDPRNYHTVLPVADSRRVSLGFFVAVTIDGRLLLWS